MWNEGCTLRVRSHQVTMGTLRVRSHHHSRYPLRTFWAFLSATLLVHSAARSVIRFKVRVNVFLRCKSTTQPFALEEKATRTDVRLTTTNTCPSQLLNLHKLCVSFVMTPRGHVDGLSRELSLNMCVTPPGFILVSHDVFHENTY